VKIIKRDRTFEKHFKERVSPNGQLVKQFKDSLDLFREDKLDFVSDHALHGKLAGKKSIFYY
jgi:hypothetical protein